MYELLCRRLPPRWAAIVLVLWYAALLLLLMWNWDVSGASFRYGRL
jgi:hypothetical protein